MTDYPTIPVRIYLANGEVHVVVRIGLSAAVAEFPDAVRVERVDVHLPSCVGCPNIGGAFW